MNGFLKAAVSMGTRTAQRFSLARIVNGKRVSNGMIQAKTIIMKNRRWRKKTRVLNEYYKSEMKQGLRSI